MKIIFRTDASVEIGTGHVMRCLTLADALRERGAETIFISRPHRGHLLAHIRERGHVVRALLPPPQSPAVGAEYTSHAAWLGLGWEEDAQETLQLLGEECADWLVVDHYALDLRWERALFPVSQRLMVMDDLADRSHDCDLLLDPTLGRKRVDYAELLPDRTKALFGPRHALLRPEFSALRAESLARRERPKLRQLLITMGGVDKDNATAEVLGALERSSLPSDVKIIAVMGPNSPCLVEVRAQAARMRLETEVRVGVTDMARLMTESDLAIGAGGGTSWERCCLGLPAFLLQLAGNQRAMATTLQDAGAVIAVKNAAELTRHLDELLATCTMEPFLARASRDARQVTDGRGVERVCREMQA